MRKLVMILLLLGAILNSVLAVAFASSLWWTLPAVVCVIIIYGLGWLRWNSFLWWR